MIDRDKGFHSLGDVGPGLRGGATTQICSSSVDGSWRDGQQWEA